MEINTSRMDAVTSNAGFSMLSTACFPLFPLCTSTSNTSVSTLETSATTLLSLQRLSVYSQVALEVLVGCFQDLQTVVRIFDFPHLVHQGRSGNGVTAVEFPTRRYGLVRTWTMAKSSLSESGATSNIGLPLVDRESKPHIEILKRLVITADHKSWHFSTHYRSNDLR